MEKVKSNALWNVLTVESLVNPIIASKNPNNMAFLRMAGTIHLLQDAPIGNFCSQFVRTKTVSNTHLVTLKLIQAMTPALAQSGRPLALTRTRPAHSQAIAIGPYIPRTKESIGIEKITGYQARCFVFE